MTITESKGIAKDNNNSITTITIIKTTITRIKGNIDKDCNN